MKNSANSNMYSFACDTAWERYSAHLSGAREGTVCVIAQTQPTPQARHALDASFERLGYGDNACTWICLGADGSSSANAQVNAMSLPPQMKGDAREALQQKPDAPAPADSPATGLDMLSTSDVLTIIESIDPLCLVAADIVSGRTLSAAYQQTITPFVRTRLLGRDTLVIDNLEQALGTDAAKQHLWAALKTLAFRV